MGLKILFNFSAEKKTIKYKCRLLVLQVKGLEVCLCVLAGSTQREDKKPDSVSWSTAAEIMKLHFKQLFSRYVSHFLHLFVCRG